METVQPEWYELQLLMDIAIPYTPQSALSDGSHTITVNVSDNDGNVATQKSVTFTVDTVAPILNVTAPVDSLKTNIALVNVIGTTNDATSSSVIVTIKLNGVDQGAVTLTSGNFTKAITLKAGANTIVVRATDLAGKYTEVTRNGHIKPVSTGNKQYRNYTQPCQCRRINHDILHRNR